MERYSKKIDRYADLDKTGGLWEVSGDRIVSKKNRKEDIKSYLQTDKFNPIYAMGQHVVVATRDITEAGIITDISDDETYTVKLQGGKTVIVKESELFEQDGDIF